MPELTVTINVPDFTDAEIRAAVIDAAMNKVLGISRLEDIDEYGVTFTEMRRKVEGQTETLIRDAVAARVPAVVDEVLAREFQPMSRWGERLGPPTTIRAMIGEYAESWLTEKVDDQGRGRAENSCGDRKTLRMHFLIRKEVDAAFKGDLAKLAAAAAEEVKAGLTGRVGAEVTETVRRLLGLPKA